VVVVALACTTACLGSAAPVPQSTLTPTPAASTPVATEAGPIRPATGEPEPVAAGVGVSASITATATPSVVAVPTLGIGPDSSRLPNADAVLVPPPGSCHIVDGLPDHTCTPGLLNPRLTPAQACAPGFSTRTIRPPTNYTDALKSRLMISYGQVGTSPLTGRPWSPSDVELDHAASLEDLGHPWSPLNLWPEPRRATGAEPNAEEKDQVETIVHNLICADQTHAADYAARLAADWTQFRRGSLPAEAAPTEPEP
jgi:hypothetical protein